MKSLLVSTLLLCCITEVNTLARGIYPRYNFLCGGTGIKAVDFDCTGFLQCIDTTAYWQTCPPNQFFDGAVSCSGDNRNCKNLRDVVNATCPFHSTLTFPHPESCAMFYNCNRTIPIDGLLQYEDECPFPQLYDSDTKTCIDPNTNPNITCQAPTPLDQCSYHLECGRPVCTGLPDGEHGYSTQPFDVEYVVCKGGLVETVKQCKGPGEVFDPIARLCTINYKPSIATYCQRNSTAITTFASPESCSLFYNCSNIAARPNSTLEEYQDECPYLFLFDPVARICKFYPGVMCGLRSEPKAPCDYVIGHCIGREKCIPCEASCVGLNDGPNIYPGKALTSEYLDCHKERTRNMKVCLGGKIFDPMVEECGSEISTETLELFCAKNPAMIIPHPGECAQFYDCQKVMASGNLNKFVRECLFPQVFDPTDNTCKDRQRVTCHYRRQPVSMCDYLQHQCVGQSCAPCIDTLPSCAGKIDGRWPLVGEEMTAFFVVCTGGIFTTIGQCPNGELFDLLAKTCTPTVNVASLEAFCTLHPDSALANPQHCGQYYKCSPAGNPPTAVSECVYPQEFSISGKVCRPYTDVDCAERVEKVRGCDYTGINTCKVADITCTCPFPSCFGQPNGATSGYPGDNTMYYTCRDNRTIVTACTPGFFDPTILGCSGVTTTPAATTTMSPIITTPRGPVPPTSPRDNVDTLTKAQAVCRTSPTAIIPHSKNCHWFYNCSNLVGESECIYPFLFDITSEMCVEYSLADCGLRKEPKQMCEYEQFLSKFPSCANAIICSECERYYPSCAGRQNNYQSGISTDRTRFYECRDERTSFYSCPSGQEYDGAMCSATPAATVGASNDAEAKTLCAQDPSRPIPHNNHCAKYFECKPVGMAIERECVYPQLFDTATRRCVTATRCGSRTEFKTPCSYDSVLRRYKRVCTKGQLCPQCEADYPSCVGRPDNFKGPIQTDEVMFYVCNNERTTIDTCIVIGSIFMPAKQECMIPPTDPLPIVDPTRVAVECTQQPTGVFLMENSCARYYNCSLPTSKFGAFVAECDYPMLFDSFLGRCVEYIVAKCSPRPVEKEPCEYLSIRRQYCTTDGSCRACDVANPSCKGKPDNFVAALQINNYAFYTCLDSRTVAATCNVGQIFNSTTSVCEALPTTTTPATTSTTTTTTTITTTTTTIPTTTVTTTSAPRFQTVSAQDIGRYCAFNPTRQAFHPDSCAMFWNCSNPNPKYGIQYLFECTYPKHFDGKTGACVDFPLADCGTRRKVMAPCEYIQFTVMLCQDIKSCRACDETQLSCRGKADGYKDAMLEDQSSYFQCQDQRTTIMSCPGTQQFDPITADCKIPGAPTIPVMTTSTEAEGPCLSSPTAKFPHAENCHQYFDCAVQNGPFGRFLTECPYPDLFDPTSASCKDHSLVACGRRYEPRLRCEYWAILTKYCRIVGTNCQDCANSNPSCVAQTDGLTGPLPGSRTQYYNCSKDRTLVSDCPPTYEFNTATRRCQSLIYMSSSAEAETYCSSIPTGVYPSSISCAQYFNCSEPASRFGRYRLECPYPQLFDVESRTCKDHMQVTCGSSPEVKDACEYIVNSQLYTGIPCTKPSCAGKIDGLHYYPGRELGEEFIQCRNERLVVVTNCGLNQYFDPVNKNCRTALTQSAVNFFCQTYPGKRAPNPINCAQYINCASSQPQIIECGYPRLFNGSVCIDPEFVKCGKRYEPVAPCDYEQNKPCPKSQVNCLPCEKRIPSCVGLPDGNQSYPGLPPSTLFVKCRNNRTESVIRCKSDLFNPHTGECGGTISQYRIEDACRKFPTAIFADPDNCARYIDCSKPYKYILNTLYKQECKYPELFSVETNTCVNIFKDISTSVDCGNRTEPLNACDYHEHCGINNYPYCTNCTNTIPSCVGQPDQQYLNFPVGNVTSPRYFLCYRHRTVVYGNCSDKERFDTRLMTCVPL